MKREREKKKVGEQNREGEEDSGIRRVMERSIERKNACRKEEREKIERGKNRKAEEGKTERGIERKGKIGREEGREKESRMKEEREKGREGVRAGQFGLKMGNCLGLYLKKDYREEISGRKSQVFA